MSRFQSLRGQPWPLLLLAAPAFVAVWSGWVGLGTMTGFGEVRPLPGIADEFTVNTAITLPIGVEAYGAYALGTWLSHKRLSDTTRRFAAVSAVGAMLLGMAGQVAYHLLSVAGRTQAPWWIVTLVSCFPVLVLGLGATLAHLIRRDAHAGDVPAEGPVEVREAARTNGATVTATVDTPPVPDWQVPVPANGRPVLAPVSDPTDLQLRAAREFADDITSGRVPGIKVIKQQLKIGQSNAQKVRAYLSALANE